MLKQILQSRRNVWWLLALLIVASLLASCQPEVVVETRVVKEIETRVVTEIETRVVTEVETRIVTEVVTEEVIVTATPMPEKTEGGTLIFGTSLAAEFPINPVLNNHRPGIWLFDALVELDAATTQPAPSLAESWTVSDDGLEYVFTLRQDVKWHDGEQFDADDVIFTFNAYLNDPDSRIATTFVYDVEGEKVPMTVEKVDDYTVKFTLPKPSSLFLNNVCCWNGIVPEHLLSGYEKLVDAVEFNENPVGTGVLVFEELAPQEYVRFGMNKEFWRGRPALDGFIWRVIPDDDAQVTAMANGEMDVMKNVSTEDVASRISEIPGVTVYSLIGNFTYAFYFNPERIPAFQDIQVREAIAWAIDKPTIIKAVVGATVPHAEQIFPPGYWGYNPDVRVIGYDPEIAASLLDEAGWVDSDGDGIRDKDGEPLTFYVMTERTLLPEAIQGYLTAVGIDMQIKEVERAVRRENQTSGDWDAYIGWDGSGVPFSALIYNWMSDSWNTYNNPDLDALVLRADAATDPAERTSSAQEAVRIMTDDVAAIWLYNYTSRIAVSDNIKGLQLPPTTADLNNTGVFYHLEDLYMAEPQ